MFHRVHCSVPMPTTNGLNQRQWPETRYMFVTMKALTMSHCSHRGPSVLCEVVGAPIKQPEKKMGSRSRDQGIMDERGTSSSPCSVLIRCWVLTVKTSCVNLITVDRNRRGVLKTGTHQAMDTLSMDPRH